MKQTVSSTVSAPISKTHRKHIAVIGGGFGGLATAIRLQASGLQVTLVEARENLGGRAYQLKDQGFTFDMGPTLITAPELLEELWQMAGRSMHEDISLVELSPFYRIIFHDGRSFDYWGKQAQDEAEIARFEPRDVEGYRAFLAATKHIYERAFVDLAAQPFLTLNSLLRVTPELLRVGAHRSVYSFASRYFSNPYLRMVFSFHPLFIGGNPFRASAIYSIVPYLERQGGVHFAQGGMYTVIEALANLLRSLGGEIRCGNAVEQILVNERQVTGVLLQDGTVLSSEGVVANSDVAHTYLHMLPQKQQPRILTERLKHSRYSMSCFLLYLGIQRQYPQLRHHTIVMPQDYRKLIHNIFDGQGLPDDLALYVHTPTRTDPTLAPPGGESLYVLVPVPNLAHGIDWSDTTTLLRDRIVHFLEEKIGLEGLAENIVVEHMFTPLDFAGELRSHLGAAFSLEPTLAQSAYFRPHNRDDTIGGLYFVGAGTHPGAGIPGVLLSAKLTSGLISHDYGLSPLAPRAEVR